MYSKMSSMAIDKKLSNFIKRIYWQRVDCYKLLYNWSWNKGDISFWHLDVNNVSVKLNDIVEAVKGFKNLLDTMTDNIILQIMLSVLGI